MQTQNANATAITAAWRALVNAAVNGEVSRTVGPYLYVGIVFLCWLCVYSFHVFYFWYVCRCLQRYDVTDVGRQVLFNLFSDLHSLNEQARLSVLCFCHRGVLSSVRVLFL